MPLATNLRLFGDLLRLDPVERAVPQFIVAASFCTQLGHLLEGVFDKFSTTGIHHLIAEATGHYAPFSASNYPDIALERSLVLEPALGPTLAHLRGRTSDHALADLLAGPCAGLCTHGSTNGLFSVRRR